MATLNKYERLALYSGMPVKTSYTHRLYNFAPRKETQVAYNEALKFISEDRRHHFIMFGGEPGRGKTHLALGIGWHWLDNDMGPVKYYQVEVLLDLMRAEFDKPPQTESGTPLLGQLEQAKRVDLLVLDDLGAEKSSEWAIAKLDELIDHRYIQAKLTVFTTNLLLAQLQKRISSRITEGVTVMLAGPDYRKYKAKQGEK